MKNHCRDAMQRMWKNQLSHEYKQNQYSEIGIDEILQARQEKNHSRIERKIEIIFIISYVFF